MTFIFKTPRFDENLSIDATAVVLATGLHSAVPIPCWIAKYSRPAFGFGTDSGTDYWKVYFLFPVVGFGTEKIGLLEVRTTGRCTSCSLSLVSALKRSDYWRYGLLEGVSARKVVRTVEQLLFLGMFMGLLLVFSTKVHCSRRLRHRQWYMGRKRVLRQVALWCLLALSVS